MADKIKVQPAVAIAWLRRRMRRSTRRWRPCSTTYWRPCWMPWRGGTTVDKFQQDYDRIVQAHGWSYHGNAGWHSRLIFRMQTQNAYMAGHWEAVQRVLAANRGRVEYFLRL